MEIRINRTFEGTIFEVVCAIIILATWGVALIGMRGVIGQLSETDGGKLLILTIVDTLCVAYLLYCAYRPKRLKASFSRLCTLGQYARASRCARILGVEVAGFVLLIIAQEARLLSKSPFITAYYALILLSVPFFSYYVYRKS
ncbi:MAG: hypothetical protein IJV27_05040 [Prevotella sp.]|nr:hypothetical protein [Prevotella sp.]